MAKKSKSSKSSKPRKIAAKPARVVARPAKPAARAKKPAAPKRSSLAPTPVKTGAGPTPAEIGADLVGLFNAGRAVEVETKWWAPEIVSVEGMGMAWSGRAAVEIKNKDWLDKHTILGGAAEGPYVGATGFAVKLRMHVKEIATGNETQMEEVGVYTVKNGKIVREEFMYGSDGM